MLEFWGGVAPVLLLVRPYYKASDNFKTCNCKVNITASYFVTFNQEQTST